MTNQGRYNFFWRFWEIKKTESLDSIIAWELIGAGVCVNTTAGGGCAFLLLGELDLGTDGGSDLGMVGLDRLGEVGGSGVESGFVGEPVNLNRLG